MKLTGRLTEEALEADFRAGLLEAFRDFRRAGGASNGAPPDDV
jgi:hypothetical protein